MNKTNIAYKGDVVIRLVIGGKTITLRNKNEGTKDLKKGLCQLLVGYDVRDTYTPQNIDLRKKVVSNGSSNSEGEYISFLNRQIELTGKTCLYIENDTELGIKGNWVARFNAAIPFKALMNEVKGDEDSEYELVLYGNYDANEFDNKFHDLAKIKVSASDLARIKPGTQALIEWNMQIFNYNEIVTN